MAVYEFAIKKEILNNGEEILTPVARIKRRFFPNPWERITCIYGTYLLVDLDFAPKLALDECIIHIKEYQKVLKNRVAHKVKDDEYHYLQEYIAEGS